MREVFRRYFTINLFLAAGILFLVLSLAGCAAFFEDYAYQPLGASQADTY
ncbi:MAG TPA: hypothetical protein PKL97_04565 [Candidatus Omnitrophota bacterium]|nr:hypothetical protein [Candidatus Omnitrophota bacterium]